MTPDELTAVETRIRGGRPAFAPPQPPVHVRWMIRRDMAEVVAIEAASFGSPRTEQDFLDLLRQRNCIGMVAECPVTGRVLGYVLRELHKECEHLLTLAVAPDARGRGVGRAIVEKLKAKLQPYVRGSMSVTVHESNLGAQLFFRSAGLLATKVLPGHFGDGDGYVMEYFA